MGPLLKETVENIMDLNDLDCTDAKLSVIEYFEHAFTCSDFRKEMLLDDKILEALLEHQHTYGVNH